MTKHLKLGGVVLGLLLVCCACTWPRRQARRRDSICAIVQNPKKYANRHVVVRGLIRYPIGDAAPPPVVTGNCKWGIPLIGWNSPRLKESRGYKALMEAVYRARAHGGPKGRVWATVGGTIRVTGKTFHMDLASISGVAVLAPAEAKTGTASKP